MAIEPSDGPWHWEFVSGDGINVYDARNEVCICQRWPADEQAVADMRLVASSWRLFRALRAIIEIGKRDTSNPKYDGHYDEARAAIAEATGGPQ